MKGEEKLRETNSREMKLIYNRRTGLMATEKQAKVKGRFLEEFALNMTLTDANDGMYFMSSPNFPKKRLVCTRSNQEISGMDLLKQCYEGWAKSGPTFSNPR